MQSTSRDWRYRGVAKVGETFDSPSITVKNFYCSSGVILSESRVWKPKQGLTGFFNK
jgi:hypothetical protein